MEEKAEESDRREGKMKEVESEEQIGRSGDSSNQRDNGGIYLLCPTVSQSSGSR